MRKRTDCIGSRLPGYLSQDSSKEKLVRLFETAFSLEKNVLRPNGCCWLVSFFKQTGNKTLFAGVFFRTESFHLLRLPTISLIQVCNLSSITQ